MNYRGLIYSVSLYLIANASLASEPANQTKLSELVDQFAYHSGDTFIYDSALTKNIHAVNIDYNKFSLNQLKSILSVYGFAVVEVNSQFVIADIAKIRQLAPTQQLNPSTTPNDFDIISKTVTLKNTDPLTVVPPLRPLMPKIAHLGQSGNQIILSGFRINVESIEQLIKEIDRRSNAQQQSQLNQTSTHQ